ncbi:MAG: VOC family protein [Planctomycetota bacterium]|nr:VOC family protein [Planctomycetota bacterium]
MNIEHMALQVARPADMARWWCDNLGMKVLRQMGPEAFFLADQAGRVVLEIYHNPAVAVPDYAQWEPARFHIAFASPDVPADAARLVAAGGRLEGTLADIKPTDSGDVFAIVRDPWGVAVQLVRRANPLGR